MYRPSGFPACLAMFLLLGACSAATPDDKARCSDGVRNGTETDIDCGGSQCAPCASPARSLAPSDCASGVCQEGVCRGGTCADGIKNGAETDVDCGGSCAACGDGKGCLVAEQC